MLIVLEGIDGSGKSTVARFLAETLRTRGIEVLLTREPWDSEAGRRLRELLALPKRASTPREEFELFHEDRIQHVRQVVRPAQERGDWVVQDRTFFSTAAYQGALGLDVEEILALSRKVAPEPDLALFLSIDPTVALQRISASRPSYSSFERLDYLREVDRNFRDLARTQRCFETIDASQSIDKVELQVLETCERRLPLFPRTLR